eukprot:gene2362-8670_t
MQVAHSSRPCARPSRASVRARPTRETSVRVNAFFSNFLGGGAATKRAQAKADLLALIGPLKRGVTATEEDKAAVDKAASVLEKLNPNKKTLSSPLMNGSWELLYTTSATIIGKDKLPPFRPWGKIFQILDAETLTARNQETAPFFNSVNAELSPMSASEVAVQFKQFKILGLITVTAPESAKGTLDITYLDEDLRLWQSSELLRERK